MRWSAAWLVNAALRTLQAAFPALADPDDDWALSVLDPAERRLYGAMPAFERAHAVKVARCMKARRPDASREALRAALLHDVGKLGTSSLVAHRVLAHLLPEVDVPAEPRLAGLAGARQARRHHAAYGALMVLTASGDARVAWLVRHHHDPRGDAEAELIMGCDEDT
ncbi:MAG TPA: HD domain-containing protein [Trueperaceae bacterium]|nr:HD domain-containing protein [Trueperaceae bacterium]